MHTQSAPQRPVATQIALAACAFLLTSSAALAAPVDGRVVAGQANISAQGNTTRIEQASDRAIVNWRGFGIDANEAVQFVQPSSTSATLNRVTGEQVSVLLGRMDANGQVMLINPNGVIIGNGAEINVSSFIASTANMSDENFLTGQLIFDEPGRPGAQVINEGLISAAEGGLVALVAPHVQNDGVIRARLGKVVLGAGDTFTVDLHGDGLINLAVAPETAAALLGVSVANAGTVDVGAGRAVLMTAADASGVVDSVINMSGTVLANSAEQVGGKIVLAGDGADITVSGTLDASGALGGGTVHVGGQWQGGDGPRAANTTLAETALVDVSAVASGDAGEAVIWSDGHTEYAGNINARGGSLFGDGGDVEVSGLQTLKFAGLVDAGADNGIAGLLLLDPAILTVLAEDAALLSLVLSNGTAVSLDASDTININSVIDGRGKVAGGSITLNAGNHININDFLVTNNGAINLNATAGNVTVAAGKALFAGSAPISVVAGGNVSTGQMITTGLLNIRSTGGNVTVADIITQSNRDVMIRAAMDVLVNSPIVNFLNGSDLDLIADTGDIIVGAQIDGRDGVAGGSGAVTLTAGNNILLNSSVLSDGGNIIVNAGGTFSAGGVFGLFADTAPISVTAAGDITTMAMITSGLLSVESTGGSITTGSAINELNGDVSLLAANNLAVDHALVNFLNGSSLSLVATTGNLTVNAQIDGRDTGAFPGSSGPLTLTAGNDFLLNDNIVTDNAALTVNAGGAFTPTGSNGLFAGTAPITVTTGGNLTTAPMVTSGDVTARSTGGTLTVASGIDDSYQNVSLRADGDLVVNESIVNFSNGSVLDLISDNGDVIVNAQIDGRDTNGASSAPLTILAGNNIQLGVGGDVITENADLTLTATNGTLTSSGGGLFSGSGDLTVVAGGNLNTGVFGTTGTLAMRSTGGALTVDQKVDETVGSVNLRAATDLNVNSEIANIRTGSNLLLTADTGNININDRIDAQDDTLTTALPVAGGSVTLQAGNDINLNETITTFEGAIDITATNGQLNIASLPAPDYTKRILVTDSSGDIGSAPISITTGGNLSTGPAIDPAATVPAAPCEPTCTPIELDDHFTDVMKQFVAISTLGDISLTSTSGDVTVDAPLPKQVGAVTISAGEAVGINQHLLTNGLSTSEIQIYAGAGGVTVNDATFPVGLTNNNTLVDSADANLLINSVGTIDIRNGGVASNTDITLTSTAGDIIGLIGLSTGSYTVADNLTMTAFGNIGELGSTFNAQLVSDSVTATSETGFIRISVAGPGSLNLTTEFADLASTAAFPTSGDIEIFGGQLGFTVTVDAARDIRIPFGADAGTVSLTAGRDITMVGGFDLTSISAVANRDFSYDFTGAEVGGFYIKSSADTVLTATTGSVQFLNDASILSSSSDVIITAGDSVLLNEIQTDGSLSVTALNGSITLTETLGAQLNVVDPPSGPFDSLPLIDTGNDGLEALTLLANGTSGSITMEGARAAGTVDVQTSGLLTTSKEIRSFTELFITASNASHDSTMGDGLVFGAPGVGTQDQLWIRLPFLGVASPGPGIAPPPAPPAISATPPTDPGAINVAGLSDPSGGSVGSTSEPGSLDLNALPAPATGGGDTGGSTNEQDNTQNAVDEFGEIVPGESPEVADGDAAPGPDGDSGEDGTGAGNESDGSGDFFLAGSDGGEITEVLVFEGGSGPAAESDLGQSGNYSVAEPPEGEEVGASGDGDCTDEDACEES